MRVLFAAFCLVTFVVTWFVMSFTVFVLLISIPNSDLPRAERIQEGFLRSVTGEMPHAGTLLCTLNALTQYGFRHCARRIAEEGDPEPTRGFRWMRALQSVVIAWILWYAAIVSHCWTGPP